MKRKAFWFAGGLALGATGLVVARCRQARHEQILAWQKQRSPALDILACPRCHGAMASSAPRDGYRCTACGREYPVAEGIAHFVEPQELNGLNGTLAGFYDWFSWVYRLFSVAAFAYIGMPEEQARREVTDRLDPKGGPVLEVSIGPGVNLPYLVGRQDVGSIVGLDLSLGQLRRCRDYAARRGWNLQLDLGNAERLPYADNTFNGVFHIGGINFFNDRQKAIEEMIRVAKPGARILIADETEQGAQMYEKLLPGFKRSFQGGREPVKPPFDLVPEEMLERRLFEIWKGWLYCIEFRKPPVDVF